MMERGGGGGAVHRDGERALAPPAGPNPEAVAVWGEVLGRLRASRLRRASMAWGASGSGPGPGTGCSSRTWQGRKVACSDLVEP